MIDKEKCKLDEKIDLYDGHLIRVFSADQKIAYQRWIITQEFEVVPISFREIMEEAKVNLKEWGSVFIIIESLLDGVIYQFGNHDLKNVYKHGETRGYA